MSPRACATAGRPGSLNNCHHGTGTMPNLGAYDRRMLAVAYRPSWAGPAPMETLPQWDLAEVAALPSCAQPFFNDPNLREGFQYDAPNKPQNMRSDAIGLRVARYGSSKL